MPVGSGVEKDRTGALGQNIVNMAFTTIIMGVRMFYALVSDDNYHTGVITRLKLHGLGVISG